MTWTPTVSNCDHYLGARTGKYEWRRIRYMAALRAMQAHSLTDNDTIMDVGAGWTELDVCLRVDGNWRGRYIPVDGGIDGTDLNNWMPSRMVEWAVALEIIEHLEEPFRMLERVANYTHKGIVVSTPNPRVVDVLAIDPTHVRPVTQGELEDWGFQVREESFYGQPSDSLFGVWTT